jgi:hypothetical protein
MKNIFILLLVFAVFSSLSLAQDHNNAKQNKTNSKINHSIGNNFNTGANLHSPVFFDNFGPESFEDPNFPPAGWSRFTAANNVIQWDRITLGVLPPGWNPGFGLETTVPPGGGTAVAMATYDANGPITNDIWLVTPKLYNINLADSLTFWVQVKGGYADNLDVKISKTVNNNASAFTITAALYNFFATSDTSWARKSIYLGSVSGLNSGDSVYIGFREHVANNLSDGAIVNLDLVAGVGSIVLSAGNHYGLVPDQYGISQNYPNPFNPSTTIYYNLPKSGNVTIKVYDVLGNEVSTLVNEYKIAGTHRIVFNSGNLSSGVYFYQLTAGDFVKTLKMTLIK